MKIRSARPFSLFLLLVGWVLASPAWAQNTPGNVILGTWADEQGEMQVEIFTCGEAYCGKIVGLRDPLKNGQPRLDEKNPDKALRDRPVMGLQIISDLFYEGEQKWRAGTMYAPQRGKHVNVTFTLLDPQRLEASVSKFIFRKTITWTRINEERGGKPLWIN